MPSFHRSPLIVAYLGKTQHLIITGGRNFKGPNGGLTSSTCVDRGCDIHSFRSRAIHRFFLRSVKFTKSRSIKWSDERKERVWSRFFGISYCADKIKMVKGGGKGEGKGEKGAGKIDGWRVERVPHISHLLSDPMWWSNCRWSRLWCLFRRPPCTAYVRIRWFASSDRPLDRPTKMAGETFSCWSTQVNKDALFVTAILLLSIARLSERLVQTIPKRRTRPNFSLPSIFLQLTLRSKYTYAFEKKKTCNTFERVIDYRLRINRNEGCRFRYLLIDDGEKTN